MIDPKSIPERWRDWFEERAAIIEYEGGIANKVAEKTGTSMREVSEQIALAMLKTYLTKLQKARAA